jgi:hypothetical protein
MAAKCEWKSLSGEICGLAAPYRLLIERVNIKDYHDRRNFFDKYLCKKHYPDLPT